MAKEIALRQTPVLPFAFRKTKEQQIKIYCSLCGYIMKTHWQNQYTKGSKRTLGNKLSAPVR